MGPRVLLLFACTFTLGLVLQLLACTLYDNWWPMLNVLMYVLAPMPTIFFGSSSYGDYGSWSASGGSPWEDAGKFLTGFTVVGSVAIPCILYHGAIITSGALLMSLSSFGVLALTAIGYDYYASSDYL